MARQSVYQSFIPEGCEIAGSGQGHSLVTNIAPAGMSPGIEAADPTGNPIKTVIPTCIGLNKHEERCMAPQAKGTEHCIGHLSRIEKQAKIESL